MGPLSSSQEYVDDLDHARGYIPRFLAHGGTVLVTGSTGLIGSFIVDCFIRHNEVNPTHRIETTCISRSIDKLEARFGKNQKGVSFLEADVCDMDLGDVKYDCILHLASNADPRMYALYPAETITGNIIGTYRLLEWQRRLCPTARFFLASTMEVYGEKECAGDFSEFDFGLIDFNSIRSGYPESKRVSELLCRSYAREYGLETRIGRLGYIYGPTMTETDSKAVAQFIRKGIASESIELKSEGKQRRSYCYVADAVSAIFKILDSGASGEAYNISNSDSVTTVVELANCVADCAGTQVIHGVQSDLEKRGSSPTKDAVLNHEKLSSLAWFPRSSLRDGISRTMRILMTFGTGEGC